MARVDKPIEEQDIPRGNPIAIIEFLLSWYSFELGKLQTLMQEKFKNPKNIFGGKDAQTLEFIVSRIDWLEEQQIRFKKRDAEDFGKDQFKNPVAGKDAEKKTETDTGLAEGKGVVLNEGETD